VECPSCDLKQALLKDGESGESQNPVLDVDCCHLELINTYVPASANDAGTEILKEKMGSGQYIVCHISDMLPTSRGNISLLSTNPLDQPRVDPNFLSTEVDRAAFRAGVRLALSAYLDTEEMQRIIAKEIPRIAGVKTSVRR
jgi:choline dehydrogenase-like flavoprotein